MKKTLLLSLLVLVMHGLYAMEASSSSSSSSSYSSSAGDSPLACLPTKLHCKIMSHVTQEPYPIDRCAAIFDVIKYQHDAVNDVRFSPDGRFVASGGWNVRIVDISTGKTVVEYQHDQGVWSVCFSPEGNFVASYDHGNVMMVDSRTGEPVAEYRHDQWVCSIGFSGGRLVVLGKDYEKVKAKVETVDIRTGRKLIAYKHGDWVCLVCISPDGRLMGLSNYDGKVNIVDISTGETVIKYRYDGPVNLQCISPNGRLMAIGDVDGKVDIVDIRTRETVIKYQHDAPVQGTVCISSDGSLMAIGDDDGKVNIVDIRTGERLAEYGHDGCVSSVCISPDGLMMASGGADGEVMVKSIAPLLLARYCGAQTINQYLFIKELRQKVLDKKESLVIGQARRQMLQQMPELKKLLLIEENGRTKGRKAKLWRLSLKGPMDRADGAETEEDGIRRSKRSRYTI